MKKIQQVKTGLAISIFILLCILYAVLAINRNDKESTQRAVRSAYIILELEEVSGHIYAVESMRCRYALTHDARFLAAGALRGDALRQQLRKLERMVAHNPVQLASARELQQLTLVALQRLKQPELNASEQVTTAAIDKAAAMKHIEEMLMNKRLNDSRLWFNESTVAVIISVVTAMLLITIAYFVFMREFREKVSAEKKLLSFQQLLQEKIGKLDESNRELEQFAYIASHDLQEPLRKIITFNERIRQKFTDHVAPEMRDYLDRISSAATRMRVLIDDLLAYSRLTKSGINRAYTDLEQVIHIIKDNCEVLIQQRHVQFIHRDPLPVLSADKTQMIQLFQNLISNAIKFTRTDISPVIEFSCALVGKEELAKEPVQPVHEQYYKIVVKDNGIGFPEQYADKIFIVFHRLHGRSEYEGTGIGLSICKKIVENHEGYIRARSESEKGAEFSVFMPKIN